MFQKRDSLAVPQPTSTSRAAFMDIFIGITGHNSFIRDYNLSVPLYTAVTTAGSTLHFVISSDGGGFAGVPHSECSPPGDGLSRSWRYFLVRSSVQRPLRS